jgi:hypothetical protein
LYIQKGFVKIRNLACPHSLVLSEAIGSPTDAH